MAPRHPPRALCSLHATATHQAVSGCAFRDAPCTQLGEIEDLQSAETYPVVKVRHGPTFVSLRPACLSARPFQRSAGRWANPTDQRNDELQTQKRRLDCRAALVWGFAPRYSFVGAVAAWSRVFRSARDGGDEETRTPDPLLAKEMLCQLSYVPWQQGSGGRHWTRTSDLCLIRAAL